MSKPKIPLPTDSVVRRTDTNITKAEYALLEKCFEREIGAALNGGLRCFQTKSKKMARLESLGLVQRTEYKLGGRFPTTISGWELTLNGNATYCMNCPGDEDI